MLIEALSFFIDRLPLVSIAIRAVMGYHRWALILPNYSTVWIRQS